MREVIIETDAMIRFDSAVDEVAGADRMLSGFVLAYGQAGRGKSVEADRYHYQRGGAYVRVWQGWSQTAFLQRLLFEVRGKNMDMPRHTGNRCKELVVQLLEAEPKPIFIDEADRLRIDRIEDLRDIHEMTGAPVVLIGEEGIFGLLHKRRRIWSRIAYEVEFGPVSPAEIALYAQQAAGLDLPLSLSTEIAQKTEGDFRLVRNMCLLLERSAKASGSFAVDQKMLDTARVRVWEKSRRIGASYCEASQSVMEAAKSREAGGQDTFYLSYNKEMTQTFIRDCAFWAKTLNVLAEKSEEIVLRDEDRDITVYRIRSGERNYSLHRTTLDDAIADGLFKTICKRANPPVSGHRRPRRHGGPVSSRTTATGPTRNCSASPTAPAVPT